MLPFISGSRKFKNALWAACDFCFVSNDVYRNISFRILSD